MAAKIKKMKPTRPMEEDRSPRSGVPGSDPRPPDPLPSYIYTRNYALASRALRFPKSLAAWQVVWRIWDVSPEPSQSPRKITSISLDVDAESETSRLFLGGVPWSVRSLRKSILCLSNLDPVFPNLWDDHRHHHGRQSKI